MKNNHLIPLLLLLCGSILQPILAQSKKLKTNISQQELLDKIKGGWAGQTIGTTYGWTSEFKFLGTYVEDYITLPWHDDYVNVAMKTFPGLYDDIYMDLMFVQVFEEKGLNASMEDFGKTFAETEFQLWAANQASRYNVRHGISPENSGHWLNNPHADDIDFQIEADFSGLMSPGMPQVATKISNKVGRMLNSGDGLYGGIFVANMYSWAFLSNDISTIVNNALKAIPAQSKFHQVISDVIKWHKKYPKDWKQTWFEVQKKWSEDVGNPTFTFYPINIDAKLNAAYVVMGLLYGEGDYTKTAEVATRSGQDADCNAATALGVLGTMIGYSNIPECWLTPLKKAEDKKFSYSPYALNDVYRIGMKHALENLRANGAKVNNNQIYFPKIETTIVDFEQNFKNHYPKERISLHKEFTDELSFDFEGIGFVLNGSAKDSKQKAGVDIIAELYINGEKIETAKLPSAYNKARADLFWRYQLPKGKHRVTVKIKEKTETQKIHAVDALIYDDTPHRGIRGGL